MCFEQAQIPSYITELITEFDESLWAALVDSMTVYAKDRIVFRLTSGMEIEILNLARVAPLLCSGAFC